MTSPTPGSSNESARAVTVAALVIAIVAGALTGIGLHKRNHDADVANRSTGPSASAMAAQAKTVLADAGQYAVDFTSFDYLTLSQDRASTAKDFTPAFAKIYTKQSAASAPLVRKAKAVAVARADSSALQSLNTVDGTASVIVAVTITTKNVKSPSGALSYYRFQIPLERQADGAWLASGMDPV
ncbi:MAG: hypothetical protein JO214_17100 [Frankiaceae bacterium]|nr:hypothetical protein [Frankiaceae bacterium]